MPTLTVDEVRDLSPNALYVEAKKGIQKDVAVLSELIPRHGFVGFIGDTEELLKRVDESKNRITFADGRFTYQEPNDTGSDSSSSTEGTDSDNTLTVPHFVSLTVEEAVELVEVFSSKNMKIKIVVEDYNDIVSHEQYQKLEQVLSTSGNVFMPFGEFSDTDCSAMMVVDENTGKVSSTKGFKDVVSNIFSPMIATLSNQSWQASAKRAVTDSGQDIVSTGKEKVSGLSKTVKSFVTKTKESAKSTKESATETVDSATRTLEDTKQKVSEKMSSSTDEDLSSQEGSSSSDSHNDHQNNENTEPTGTGIYDNGSEHVSEDKGTDHEESTESNYEPETVKFISAEDNVSDETTSATDTGDTSSVESVVVTNDEDSKDSTVSSTSTSGTIPTPVDVADTFENSALRTKVD